MICLSLTGKSFNENIKVIELYRKHIDLVELRGDYLNSEDLSRLDIFPSRTDFPVILTIRKPEDGGVFKGDETTRKKLLLNGLTGNYTYVDLEEDFTDKEIMQSAVIHQTKIIRSFHDFNGVPDNLAARIRAVSKKEIPKAAVTPLSTEDICRLLNVYEALKDVKKILPAMGSRGFWTRILAEKLGSLITYCSAEGSSAAPGHIDPKTLTDIYNYRNINDDTKVFGIVGNPVMHSRSPWIHNPGFIKTGFNGVYIPFLIDDLSMFLDNTNFLNIQGLSVTIPFKETVVPFLNLHSSDVDFIGSCNTIKKSSDGWSGINTDAEGFLLPLFQLLGKTTLKGTLCSVIGAGGAARAVVYALKKSGAEVCVLNRTPERARSLAEVFSCEWGGLDNDGMKRISEFSNIIIQCTNIGMEPDIDADPVPGYKFTGNEIVYDIIYTPRNTMFLKRASKAGCRIIDGLSMLNVQGHLQFKYFTGINYPE